MRVDETTLPDGYSLIPEVEVGSRKQDTSAYLHAISNQAGPALDIQIVTEYSRLSLYRSSITVCPNED